MPLQEIYLHSLTQSCLKSILALTNSEEISIRHSDTPVVDMAILGHHSGLKNLFLYCGVAVGLRHLENFPLERIHITNTKLDSEFLKAAKSWTNLRDLWLENVTPFGPDQLPEFPKLQSLKVPAYPEYLEAWRSWRALHPEITLKFDSVTEGHGQMPRSNIAELYRDVAILKVSKGKKTTFEAWADFREVLHLKCDNHDFGDLLLLQAAKSKKKIKVYRESDQLGISTNKLEDLKWCIDILAQSQ